MSPANAPPFSDAAVKAKTGRDWAEWCTLLDKRNATALAHPDIVRIVATLHDGGGWWLQAVTVGYERLRGKRQTLGRTDGSFAASASKTLPLARDPARELIANAAQRRRWAAPGLKPVASRSLRMLRFTDAEGRRIDMHLEVKDAQRTVVAIEVAGLASREAVDATKAVWKPALEKLHQLALAQAGKENPR